MNKVIKGVLITSVIFFLLIFAIALLNSSPEKSKEARIQVEAENKKGEFSDNDFIPGLSPADVYVDLENKGFTKKKHFGQLQLQWILNYTDNDAKYYVEVFGTETTNVFVVKAMGSNLVGDNVRSSVRSFLGMIATLKYKGSMPIKARTWVEKNAHKNISKVFGGVKYQIMGTKQKTRVLRISNAKMENIPTR